MGGGEGFEENLPMPMIMVVMVVVAAAAAAAAAAGKEGNADRSVRVPNRDKSVSGGPGGGQSACF